MLRLLMLTIALHILKVADAQVTPVQVGTPGSPGAINERLLMHTDKSFYLAGETIWFRLYCVNAGTNESLTLSKIAYVEMIPSDGKPAIQGKIELKEAKGIGHFSLPLSITSGNYVMRAYTKWMRNEGSKIFSEKLITIINTSRPLKKKAEITTSPTASQQSFMRKLDTIATGTVRISTDRNSYSKRSKVELGFEQAGNNFKDASFSISVFLVDELQPLHHGRLEDRNISHHSTTNYRQASISDQDAAATTNTYFPEYEGHVIEASVSNRQTGMPANDVAAYLSIPGQRFQFRAARTDAKGAASFVTKNYYGPGELVLQTNYYKDSMYRVDLINPFAEEPTTTGIPAFEIDEKWSNQLLQRSIGVQVENLYATENKEQYLLPEFRDTTAFYGSPDVSYNLDEYTRFMTMEEVMREFVDEVRLRKQGEQYIFEVRNSPYKLFFDNNPLVLFDGLPVFDINKIIAVDPLKVQKVEMITRRFYQGSFVHEGIVSYKSYTGNFEGYALDPNALIVEYPGIQLQREFYSPDHSVANEQSRRTPDYRNVLYWNADIPSSTLNTKLSFYTSDVPGTYAVVLQGIATDGTPSYSYRTFLVE